MTDDNQRADSTEERSIPHSRFTSKKYATVNGRRMAYVEIGSGDPIVFLHGNPTSSFEWRNVMPHLEGQGRLIAPDLIGFGDSDKLSVDMADRYSLEQHADFLFTLLEMLDVRQHVIFVVHDWGSALGFLWAYNHRHDAGALRGLAFMEAIAEPINSDDSPHVRDSFKELRSSNGEKLILEENSFILKRMPKSIMRDLSDAELEEYIRPFATAGEDRRPILTFARMLPIDGVPQSVTDIVDRYSKWLATSQVPKLFVSANPGVLIRGKVADRVRSWANITEVSVDGYHFVQEDAADSIGQAISKWLSAL